MIFLYLIEFSDVAARGNSAIYQRQDSIRLHLLKFGLRSLNIDLFCAAAYTTDGRQKQSSIQWMLHRM
jgi:hypothetical protein